jgi:DNA-binding CsgD family transcriptional regulator
MSEIAQGRPARARQVLGNPQLDHLWSPSAADSLLAFGHLELAQDRPHAAAPLFEGCGRLLTESGVTNPAWSQWRAALAGALRAVGRVEEADDLIAVELSLVASFGAPRPWGVTLRSFAESTHGAQRLDALEESVRLLRRSAARLELARSLESWGHALCASGHGPDGMARLQESLLLAQATGSRPLVKRCRAELIKGGTRVPAVGAKTSTTLTAAELRVCTMAAEGMSNREIAQALFVSRATVESHLHASYGKLGVERRGQLASILAP